MLPWQPLGARVTTEPVFLQAPAPGMLTRLVDRQQLLSSKAVVPHVTDASFAAGFVLGTPHPCRIDDEAARLGVLAKRLDDLRPERMRPLDDRLGVVDDQDPEDTTVKLPRRLTGGDRRRRGLSLDRVDEAIPGDHRREDEALHTPSPTRLVRLELADPARVHLQLFAGLAIGHRDRRSLTPKTQLIPGKPVQRPVRDVDPLTPQQFAHLGQADPAPGQELLDQRAVPLAPLPALPPRPWGPRRQALHHPAELLVRQALRTPATLQPVGLRLAHVTPHGLDVQTNQPGDRLVLPPLKPKPQNFFDIKHSHLAVSHRLLLPPPDRRKARIGSRVGSREGGGMLLKNPRSKGGMILKNRPARGGNASEKLRPQGSIVGENLQHLCGGRFGQSEVDNDGRNLWVRYSTLPDRCSGYAMYRTELVAVTPQTDWVVAYLDDRCADGKRDMFSQRTPVANYDEGRISFDPISGRVLIHGWIIQDGSENYESGGVVFALEGLTTMYEMLHSYDPPADSFSFRVPYMPEGLDRADHFDTYWGVVGRPLDLTQASPLRCRYPDEQPETGDYLTVADMVPTPTPGSAVYYVTAVEYLGERRAGRETVDGRLVGRDAKELPPCEISD